MSWRSDKFRQFAETIDRYMKAQRSHGILEAARRQRKGLRSRTIRQPGRPPLERLEPIENLVSVAPPPIGLPQDCYLPLRQIAPMMTLEEERALDIQPEIFLRDISEVFESISCL